MDKHGGNIYGSENIILDFSVSLSPLGMPEAVKDGIFDAVDSFGDYPDSNQGKLRKAIGKRHSVSWDSVACGNGAADLIYRIPLAIEKLRNKTEGRALILQPAFSCYEEALLEAGYDIENYCLKYEDDYLPGDGFIETISDGDFDVVFVCNPSNPVGALIEKEYVLKLAEICREKKCYLVLDECFLELTGRADELSLVSETEENQYLIVLRSFTKTFAMAGLRLGYTISGCKNLVEALMNIGQPWPISKPAEVAGLKAIEDEAYIQEVNDFLTEERLRVFEGLSSLGLKVLYPSSNYVFFIGPVGLKEKLLKKGLLIRDCSNFKGLERIEYEETVLGAYRIGLRMPKENDMLLEAIRDVL